MTFLCYKFVQMTQKKWFLLDNNFLRLVIAAKNESILNSWRKWLADKSVIKPGDAAHLVTTEFSMLEGLGIVVEDIPEFSLLKTTDSPGDIGCFVYDEAMKYLSPLPRLKKEHLEQRYERCIEECSSEGKILFSESFKRRIESPEFVESLNPALAVDFMLKFEYPAECFKSVHMTFWLMLKEQAEKEGEAPWFRLFEQMQSRIPGKKLNAVHTRPRADEIKKNVGLKSQKDRLDLEIVQFALSGKLVQGTRVPVEIHTCDPPEKIKDRIRLAKTVFQAIREKMDEEKIDTSIFNSFSSGWVHCFDSITGDFKESINVSTIPVL